MAGAASYLSYQSSFLPSEMPECLLCLVLSRSPCNENTYLPSCVGARRLRLRIRIGAHLQAVAVVPAAKRIAGEPLCCTIVSHMNRLGSRTTASRTTCRHLLVVPICRVAFISASRMPYQKRSMVTVTGNRTDFLFNCTNSTPLHVPVCSSLQLHGRHSRLLTREKPKPVVLQTAHRFGYRYDEAEAACAAARPSNAKSIPAGS